MPEDTRSHAIILAGGMGTRFGGPIPKQLVSLAGSPVLQHTLTRFDGAGLDSVVIAGNPEWIVDIENICTRSLHRTAWRVVDGGSSRNSSVVNALTELPQCGRVLVHDGVRPCASQDLIARVLDGLGAHQCIIPIIPSADPLVFVDGNTVTGFGDRSTVFRGQSPQGFHLEDLHRLRHTATEDELARFSTVFEVLEHVLGKVDVVCVEGEVNNHKITTPVDHMIAGRLLRVLRDDQDESRESFAWTSEQADL